VKDYYVYIMASLSTTLYVGVTNDLMRRVSEHKAGAVESFTKRYRINRLVYFEHGSDVEGAITREKQLKGWTRQRKLALISDANPQWLDLSEEWAEQPLNLTLMDRQILHSVQNDKGEGSSRDWASVSPAGKET